MRASVAIVLAIVILFLGFHALGLQSEEVRPDMNNSTNLTKDTYNTTNAIFEGVGNTASTGLAWLGVGAVVALGLGVLLGAWGGGR
jgi:ABC-type nitrate/sulfonate/bicarbonate transport system permease component